MTFLGFCDEIFGNAQANVVNKNQSLEMRPQNLYVSLSPPACMTRGVQGSVYLNVFYVNKVFIYNEQKRKECG